MLFYLLSFFRIKQKVKVLLVFNILKEFSKFKLNFLYQIIFIYLFFKLLLGKIIYLNNFDFKMKFMFIFKKNPLNSNKKIH